MTTLIVRKSNNASGKRQMCRCRGAGVVVTVIEDEEFKRPNVAGRQDMTCRRRGCFPPPDHETVPTPPSCTSLS